MNFEAAAGSAGATLTYLVVLLQFRIGDNGAEKSLEAGISCPRIH